MNKIIFFVAALGLLSIKSFGQNASPAQALRLAQSTYEQGRLHEVEAILKTYIETNRFTDQELVTAYKILINSYIYLEEPELADATMLKLLQADHYFKPNEAVDPREFIALYNTFRVDPLFSVGIKLGPTATMPAITQLFSVNSSAQGNGKFGPKVNLSIGVVFEKEFKNFFIKNFSIAPEVLFVTRAYNYTNSMFNTQDQDPSIAIITQEQNFHKQNWLDLNLLAQYKFKETSFNPYFSVGPGISYLLGATNEIRTQVKGQGAVTGPAVDTKTSYNKLAYSAIFSVGSKIRIGGFYLTGDIRYQLGLNNVVNKAARSNGEALFNYGYVPSNYRQNNFTVNAGFVIPYFNPIKLSK